MPTTTLDTIPVLIGLSEADILGPAPAGQEYGLPVIRFGNNDSSAHQLTMRNKSGAVPHGWVTTP